MKYFIIFLLTISSCSFYSKKNKNVKNENSKKSRGIAQSGINENDLSAGFVRLRDRVIGANGVRSSDDLDQLIIDVDSNYSQIQDPAERLLAAQLSFLKIYKGLIYRSKDLVDRYDFAKSGIINALRMSGQAVQIYLPTQQWDAGFKYITEPFEFSPTQAEIRGDESFKGYLEKEMIPTLKEFKSRVQAINFDQVVWDNKVFNSRAHFVDAQDRFFRMSEIEQNALLSAVESSISAAEFLKAYELTGLFDTLESLTKSFGINAVFDPTNALTEKRTKIIKKSTSLGKLQDKAALGRSYQALVKSVEHAKIAIEMSEAENRSADSWMLLNTTGINAFSRINNNMLENISSITLPGGNRTVASAVVSGEVVTVNLKKLFVDEPPTDLKQFLPTKFDEGSEYLSKNNKRYLNFLHGRAVEWNPVVYKKYFPEVNDSQDIKNTLRVLSQSYGAAGIGAPLSLFVF